MPESGLSGIIQGPPLDFSPIQRFGEQLIQARERQRAADEASINTAIQIAQYDPALAEQIGGKAMGRLYKDKGLGKTGDFFKAIGTEAATKRSQETQLFQQKMLESQTGIEASKQQTAESQARVRGLDVDLKTKQLQNQTTEMVNQAETRLRAGDYPEGAEGDRQRMSDARLVQIEKRLDAETGAELGMNPQQLKDLQDMAVQDKKAAHNKIQLEMATDLSTRMVKDPKTGKTRSLTPDEINQLTAGKAVPGLTTPDIEIKLREVAAQEKHATASMILANKQAALTDIQVAEYAAKVQESLARAKALNEKGIKTSYDDLLKTFDKLAEMKKAGLPIDSAIVQKAQDELAANLGLTPQISKSLFGLIQRRNYVVAGAEGTEGAKQDTQVPDQKRPVGTLPGRVLREGPGLAAGGEQHIVSGVSAPIAWAGQAAVDVAKTLSGGGAITPAQEQEISQKTQAYIQALIEQMMPGTGPAIRAFSKQVAQPQQ